MLYWREGRRHSGVWCVRLAGGHRTPQSRGREPGFEKESYRCTLMLEHVHVLSFHWMQRINHLETVWQNVLSWWMDIFPRSIWHPLGNSEDSSQKLSSLTCIMQELRLDIEWLSPNPVLQKNPNQKKWRCHLGLNWLKRNITVQWKGNFCP